MNSFARLKRAAAAPFRRMAHGVRAAVKHLTLKDPELYQTGYDSGLNVNVNSSTVMQLDTVWSCVRLISETIATLPLGMYRRGPSGNSRDYAADYPLHFIIHDQPNKDSSAAVFWEAFIAAMLLRGAGRAEKLYVGNRLVGLMFLNPARLEITADPITGRRRYRYPRDPDKVSDANLRDIPEDRIWTVPGFTLDGINGVSVVRYGAKVFGAALAAERAASRSFINGTMKTIYYKVEAFLKQPQRDEFKANVLGSVERGETPLLEGGIDVNATGLTPEEAQLLESRKYGVEVICRWFRVPPWMVGHTEKSTSWGTGIEQQMIGFLTFTLGPWLRRIEQAIAKDLIPPAERITYYAKFSVEGLLRADSAARAAFYAVMVNNGILTRDEVRELEDRPPMGGNAAVLTVQGAMVVLDSLTAEPGEPAQQALTQARAALRAIMGLSDKISSSEKEPEVTK